MDTYHYSKLLNGNSNQNICMLSDMNATTRINNNVEKKTLLSCAWEKLNRENFIHDKICS